MTSAIEAIQVSRHLCQMAYDAGLPSSAQERLRLTLAAVAVSAMFDATFAVWFKEVVVGFVGTFTAVTYTADNLAARLQPTRPASALPAALAGLRRNRLFLALMALNLPADALENVHLEVALAAQLLVQHDALREMTRFFGKVVSKGNTNAAYEIDARMAAFLCRRLTLEAFVKKHIDLADTAAAGPPN